MSKLLQVPLLAALLLLPVGCGSAEVGEECDDIGDTDECEDDAICTNEAGGGVCRWICENDDQCPPKNKCNGVEGTPIKSCQPEL